MENMGVFLTEIDSWYTEDKLNLIWGGQMIRHLGPCTQRAIWLYERDKFYNKP